MTPRATGLRATMWHSPGLCSRPRRSSGRNTRVGSVVGVSDDEPGETYWKVANGIRLSGMPAYTHILTETQMWQVSLLPKECRPTAARVL